MRQFSMRISLLFCVKDKIYRNIADEKNYTCSRRSQSLFKKKKVLKRLVSKSKIYHSWTFLIIFHF